MRFRIVLPVSNVILGALLFHLGDIQAKRIIVDSGGARTEGLTDVAATARYVDYALNAPAWALLGDTRDRLWSPSTYWSGYDLRYFLAVIVMWFLIGLALDQRSKGRNRQKAPLRTKWAGILAWGCVVWGLFTCYSIFPRRPYLMPLKNYLSGLVGAVSSGGYGWWWCPLGLAWGLALTAGGLYFAFGPRGQWFCGRVDSFL